MKFNPSEEWLRKMADAEDGCDVSAGHLEMPYDNYVNKAVNNGNLSKNIECQWYGESITYFNLPEREFRRLLTDAWLAGLSHSLELIESEKRRRDEQD